MLTVGLRISWMIMFRNILLSSICSFNSAMLFGSVFLILVSITSSRSKAGEFLTDLGVEMSTIYPNSSSSFGLGKSNEEALLSSYSITSCVKPSTPALYSSLPISLTIEFALTMLKFGVFSPYLLEEFSRAISEEEGPSLTELGKMPRCNLTYFILYCGNFGSVFLFMLCILRFDCFKLFIIKGMNVS